MLLMFTFFRFYCVIFFKKIKNWLQFTFEKNNLLCKNREKNNLSRGKIPAALPPGYQMVRSLNKRPISTINIFIHNVGLYMISITEKEELLMSV